MVRGARRMRGRRLIIINALIAQDFARVHVHAWTEHDPCIIQATRSMRRSKEAGRRRWLWHVHGRGMRMPRLHGRQEEGKPGAKAPAAALTLCCVVVRRCVARGDVHGDATTSNIYIGAPEGASRMRKEGGVRETWRDVMDM